MMDQADVGLLKAASGSVLAGEDVCAAAGFTRRPGSPRPRVGKLLWNFTGVEGIPEQHGEYEKQLDFSGIGNPLWRTVAQEYLFARLAPGHPSVRELPHAFRVPLTIKTCHARLARLEHWLNWLTERGVRSLAEVTQQHCEAYHQWHHHIRDKDGAVLRDSPPRYRMHFIAVMQELACYTEMFSADGYRPGFFPWPGRTAFSVAGVTHEDANKTPPLREELLQPLLAAALYVVETIGPRLLQLRTEIPAPVEPAQGPRRRRGPRGYRWPLVEAEIRARIADGRPLDELDESDVEARLADGWSADDPLLKVSLSALTASIGISGAGFSLLDKVRPLLEHAVDVVGISRPWGRDAEMVIRADVGGEVPWTEPMTEHQTAVLVNRVRTACLLVLALLTGMRTGETMEIPVDCCVPPQELGPGRMRYRLRSKLIKGQDHGGIWEEWVTVKEAYQAAKLAADLLKPGHNQAHLFGRFAFKDLYRTFREWVNGPHGQRLGLAPIPDDPISMRMLRRTLSLELAHRPGGLLAAKIQLKHVSVATTEGYAARPGGAQAKFLAEAAKEERIHKRDLTLAVFRDYQNNVMPAGPGAKDLIEFFTFVDGKLNELDSGAPNTKRGDQEVVNLLAKRAGTLHLGAANYCWFIDPSKALCLKLAGTPGAKKPMAGMCDSARCPQATHHPCHRPVWASSAESKAVFIGSIGRSQKTEKARLQGELERDLRVLAEIDAAMGSEA